MWLPAVPERCSDAVLGSRLGVLLTGRAGIREDPLEAPLGVGQVAAPEHRVGAADPAEQRGVTVACGARQLSSLDVGRFGFVEAVELAVHAGEAQLRRHHVRC
jgi:hypothetical protein